MNCSHLWRVSRMMGFRGYCVKHSLIYGLKCWSWVATKLSWSEVKTMLVFHNSKEVNLQVFKVYLFLSLFPARAAWEAGGCTPSSPAGSARLTCSNRISSTTCSRTRPTRHARTTNLLKTVYRCYAKPSNTAAGAMCPAPRRSAPYPWASQPYYITSAVWELSLILRAVHRTANWADVKPFCFPVEFRWQSMSLQAL